MLGRIIPRETIHQLRILLRSGFELSPAHDALHVVREQDLLLDSIIGIPAGVYQLLGLAVPHLHGQERMNPLIRS